jgi:hypothetical protein
VLQNSSPVFNQVLMIPKRGSGDHNGSDFQKIAVEDQGKAIRKRGRILDDEGLGCCSVPLV